MKSTLWQTKYRGNLSRYNQRQPNAPPGDKRIQEITLKNPWQAPDLPLLKETILDIKAIDHRGVTFIVEMQIKDNPGFDKRALYYTAKAYTAQIHKSDDYPKLNQAIFFGILDFNFFDGDQYLTRHLILNSTLSNCANSTNRKTSWIGSL